MIKVLYYNYYLFYTKILLDKQPHSTVVFTLGFSLSLLFNFILNITLSYLFNYALSKYWMIGVLIALLIILYFKFYKSSRGQMIVEEKPKLFESNLFSRLYTIVFFIITASLLFIDPILTKELLR